MHDSVLSMLSIAAKSGNVVSGEFSTEKAVKSRLPVCPFRHANPTGNQPTSSRCAVRLLQHFQQTGLGYPLPEHDPTWESSISQFGTVFPSPSIAGRSEERRVGKECRL